MATDSIPSRPPSFYHAEIVKRGWDRDKNAAINIRNVFLSICTTRLPPLHYQRGFEME
jgi:hypothetical protein